MLRPKAELFITTRDRKRKFEVPEGLSVFKDLYGHPVLKGDVGHIGIVLSPHMVSFMKLGKVRKTKRVSLLMLCITVLLTVTDTSSHVRLKLGGDRVLTITVDNKVRMDVPEEHKWRRRPRSRVHETKTFLISSAGRSGVKSECLGITWSENVEDRH